ncbi:MAG: hypothetical protein FIB00_16720 [Chloroflexi bacterium]|nr:hypothetical protein [Chloroflexota bacterium]PWB43388.1 MAG: hypothetical protein C3F10_11930 [Dehalococcoidia bacterium]
MISPSPDHRHIDAARQVAMQFRELTGIGGDPDQVAAWIDTLADLIAALHHLADVEIGSDAFDTVLEHAAFNYAYALRPDDEDGDR